MNSRNVRNTKAVILETALKIASRDGIEGLTIGELAKAVGMSKSGLFAHFQGKDNLQLSVLKLATERFVEAVLRPAFQETRGLPRIEAMLRNWLKHLNDSDALPGGSVLIAASIELDDRPGELRDYVQKAQKDLILNIEKAATIAVAEGHFRRDLDVEQFAWSLYSFVLGYHHFKRMLEDPKAEEHLMRSFRGLIQVSLAGNERMAHANDGERSGTRASEPPRSVVAPGNDRGSPPRFRPPPLASAKARKRREPGRPEAGREEEEE